MVASTQIAEEPLFSNFSQSKACISRILPIFANEPTKRNSLWQDSSTLLQMSASRESSGKRYQSHWYLTFWTVCLLARNIDVASLSRQERLKYDVGLKKYSDTLSVLEGAKQDGLAEGRAKGLEEGRAEGRTEGIQSEKAETAKRLLAIGMDINTIAIATGLSAKDIEIIIKLWNWCASIVFAVPWQWLFMVVQQDQITKW